MAIEVLKRGLPAGTCLNVNIPKLPLEELKGIKICRQAAGFWEDAFEERIAPNKETYYWLTGNFQIPIKAKTPMNGHFLTDTLQLSLHNSILQLITL